MKKTNRRGIVRRSVKKQLKVIEIHAYAAYKELAGFYRKIRRFKGNGVVLELTLKTWKVK
ncbi:MAG: hypothetical protein QW056_00580 [Candidatus Bathyarchaeia archaeon]